MLEGHESQGMRVSLVDITGKQVLQKVLNDDYLNKIDVQSLGSGIYMLVVPEQDQAIKVVVNK